jgi:hypothetical protein
MFSSSTCPAWILARRTHRRSTSVLSANPSSTAKSIAPKKPREESLHRKAGRRGGANHRRTPQNLAGARSDRRDRHAITGLCELHHTL